MKRGFVVVLVVLAACTKQDKNVLPGIAEKPPTVSVISENKVFREFTTSYDQFFRLLQRNDRGKLVDAQAHAELASMAEAPSEKEKWEKFGALFSNVEQIRQEVMKRNRLFDELLRAFPGLGSLSENSRSRLIVDGMNKVRSGNARHGSVRNAILSCDDYKTTIQTCQNNRDLQTVACGLACPSIFGCVVCGTTVYFIYRNCVSNANTKWPSCVSAS